MLPIIYGKSDVQAAVCYVVDHRQTVWQIDAHVFSFSIGHIIRLFQFREGLLVRIIYCNKLRLVLLGFRAVSFQNIRKKGVSQLLRLVADVSNRIVIFFHTTDVEPRSDLVDIRHMKGLNKRNAIYFVT